MNPEVVRDAIVALESDDGVAIREIVSLLHSRRGCRSYRNAAHGQMRNQLVELLRPTFDPEVLTELDETIRDEVAEQLGTESIAKAIAALDSDDALNLDLHAGRDQTAPRPARDIICPEIYAGRGSVLSQRKAPAG